MRGARSSRGRGLYKQHRARASMPVEHASGCTLSGDDRYGRKVVSAYNLMCAVVSRLDTAGGCSAARVIEAVDCLRVHAGITGRLLSRAECGCACRPGMTALVKELLAFCESVECMLDEQLGRATRIARNEAFRMFRSEENLRLWEAVVSTPTHDNIALELSRASKFAGHDAYPFIFKCLTNVVSAGQDQLCTHRESFNMFIMPNMTSSNIHDAMYTYGHSHRLGSDQTKRVVDTVCDELARAIQTASARHEHIAPERLRVPSSDWLQAAALTIQRYQCVFPTTLYRYHAETDDSMYCELLRERDEWRTLENLIEETGPAVSDPREPLGMWRGIAPPLAVSDPRIPIEVWHEFFPHEIDRVKTSMIVGNAKELECCMSKGHVAVEWSGQTLHDTSDCFVYGELYLERLSGFFLRMSEAVCKARRMRGIFCVPFTEAL